jgi:hypothetical protein
LLWWGRRFRFACHGERSSLLEFGLLEGGQSCPRPAFSRLFGERSSPLEIGPLFCKVAEPGARDLPAKISLDISEAFL